MKKGLILFLTLFSLFAGEALAVCPVCTVAVIGGVSLSEYLGIDNTIAGIWIGGLIVSLSLWTIDWLDKKGIKFIFRKLSVFISYYLMIYFSLKTAKMLENCSLLWGQNKLILGMAIGMIGFFIGVILDNIMRKNNQDKVYFPFQKVAMPVGSLLILSIVFYFITKC